MDRPFFVFKRIGLFFSQACSYSVQKSSSNILQNKSALFVMINYLKGWSCLKK